MDIIEYIHILVLLWSKAILFDCETTSPKKRSPEARGKASNILKDIKDSNSLSYIFMAK